MRIILLVSLFLFSFTYSAKPVDSKKKELKDSLSYAIGMDVANSLKDLNVDLPTFYRGLEDAMKGGATLLTAEQVAEVKKTSFLRINEEQGEKAKKAGSEFLEQNKKNKDVVVTKSGLQYTVLKQGTGPKAVLSDKVSVNYKGTLVDGKEFDNSYTRGEPVEFPLGGVIPGWTEALQLMNVGSQYKLFIPSELAYGDRRMGPKIPPNSTLIFEVELLKIVKDSTSSSNPADPLKGLRKQEK